MPKRTLCLNDNLSEILEYNSPTTPIKATNALLSNFTNGIVPAHWHKELECIVVLSGSFTYHVNHQSYTLQEGNGIIVNSNRLHLCTPVCPPDCEHLEHFTIDETNDASYIVLLLHPDTLRFNNKMESKYINPLLYDSQSDVFFLDPSIPWQQETIHTIMNIHRSVVERAMCFELYAQSQFFKLWSLLYQNTIAKNGYDLTETDPMSPLKTMISYIQTNYQNKITLKDVAEAGAMCQSKCCQHFRETLKQSPMEYLQHYRIGKAAYLLEHTDASITEIAMECGFHGASYFTETFRKINGITPKEYRKQQGKG